MRDARIVLCLMVLGAGAQAAPEPPAEGETARRYTLFASGDTMLARWAHYHFYDLGPDWPLADIREWIAGADVAMTNLEYVVATTGMIWDKGEGRPYAYRARPETLDVLTNAGFDIVCTGNNHAMDYGPQALLEQSELLAAAGIAEFGSGKNRADAFAPKYIKVGDLVLAFLGMEDRRPLLSAKKNQPGVAHTRGRTSPQKNLKGPLAEARQHADLVIFSPHWGTNWTDNPADHRIKLAHDVIDMGADAVLGHSSHQIHGIEVYRGRPIVYDMGSLLFDRVGQKRMRWGAAFVLEFDVAGFHQLTVHPVRLERNRTRPARGADLQRIHDVVNKQSRELDPDIEFAVEGDTLVLALSPDTPSPPRQAEPARVHVSGTSRRLPDRYRERRDAKIVPAEPPEWTERFEPIEIERLGTVLGWRNSEAAQPARAFIHEVALKVSGPLKGRWFSRLEARQRDGKGAFHLWYPFADGAWVPDLWEPGQLVIDRTLARPGAVPPGVYDLFWGLQNRKNERIPDRKQYPKTPENLLPVGTIHILERGIPGGPAGVSWDGRLPPELRRKLIKDEPAPPGSAAGWIVPFAAFGLFLLIGVVTLVRSRRKG